MNSTRSFSRDPESVAAARRFTSESLGDVDAETLEVVVLMVSELATNCIRHTQSGFELAILRSPERIRVEVTDQAGGTPRMRSPAVTDPTGRGLQIVDLLSQTWGVERSAAPGKTVWFTVPASRQAAIEVDRAQPRSTPGSRAKPQSVLPQCCRSTRLSRTPRPIAITFRASFATS